MNFDIFPSVSAPGQLCTRELLEKTICNDALKPLYDAIAAAEGDKRQELKRRLPGVTWQAHFPDGRRRNGQGEWSSLYMVDVDHLDDPVAIWKTLEGRTAELGIVVAHVTPSRKGLRLVCRCRDGLTSIAANQAWLAAQTGLEIDAATKDQARLSYLVPASYFLLLDEAIWEPAPSNPLANPEKPEKTKTPENPGGIPAYRGHAIRDIAAAYIRRNGTPVEGERHVYYYKMCSQFKYITDCRQEVLLSELPDLGLSMSERKEECQHACSRHTGASIPKDFYLFLCDEGVLESYRSRMAREEKERQMAALETTADDEGDTHLKSLRKRGMEAMRRIPVLGALTRISPDNFVSPQIYAAEAALATLFTNLKAKYLDGFYHTPTVHNVIYAPASCGKSFARRTVELLTARLMRRDEHTLALEQVYLEAARKAKNAKTQPEKPALPLRIVSGIISQPKLLTRQQEAQGLHQLCFVEEIDTLNKSNRGGKYNDKGDMYRNAWDNASYSQDYMSDTTFSGRVNLFLNILATGTPEQVMKFYDNPENGLISRISICPIPNQEYATIPVWHELTADEEKEIDRVLDYADALTYALDDEGVETIRERTDITAGIQFMCKPLEAWLEEKRLLALRTQDQALDHFRKREAVKMFRMAMVCYGCFCGEMTDESKRLITDFCLWWGEQDLQNLIDIYGEMVKDTALKHHSKRDDIFAQLPDEFTAAEVEQARTKAGIGTQTKVIIYRWKIAGLIEKEDKHYRKRAKEPSPSEKMSSNP